jgi:hypothetical protein
MGWTIEPDALTELLPRLHAEYGPRPLYITENGTAVNDYADPEERVVDPERIAYLDSHLRAAQAAIEHLFPSPCVAGEGRNQTLRRSRSASARHGASGSCGRSVA